MLVILSMAGTRAISQTKRIISTREGLPQSFVSGLQQDQTGFVWIGTRNGLARYDGLNFKVFQHKSSDTSSLASDLIINIKGFNNSIWIEHESGEIDRLDPVSEKIKHYSFPAKFNYGAFFRLGWIVDSQETIWRIVDGVGLLRYGAVPRMYNRKSHGFKSDTLWGLRQGADGKLWIVTSQGLSSLNKKSGDVKNFGLAQTADYHDERFVLKFPVALHQRKNGELMWADRNFLYFFSTATKKLLKKIPFASRSDRGVTWITTGPDSNEYLERSGGIYRYDDETGLALVYGEPNVDKDPIRSFLVDKSGLIWLGTNGNGISQVDLTTPVFPSYPVTGGFAGDILKTAFDQSLPALFGWDSKDQRFSAPGYHLRSVYDKGGALWIGLKEKVVRYDPTLKTFSSLPGLAQIFNPSETGIGIKGLTMSPEGQPVVVGYNRNVLIYNSQKKVWDWLIRGEEISKKFGHYLTPQDIYMDSDRLWITTEMDGMIIIEYKTGKMYQLEHSLAGGAIPTNQLLGIKPDPSRPYLLWIGSRNGLICLNKKTLKTEVFDTRDGLPDNTIYSLLTDKYGNLWFGTNKGLCSFSTITHKVRVFQTRHGLLEDEFNRFHQLALPDGRLAFGGTNGWTMFDPNKIKHDNFQPASALTLLKINNETVTQYNGGLLAEALNASGELILPHDQNTVTFFFAGLQFNQPQDLQYRYKMTGYESDWVNSGNVSFANYTKIPPGSYEFMVNASNTTGQWSKEIKKITLTILPPLWRTWWAYLIYALLIACRRSVTAKYTFYLWRTIPNFQTSLQAAYQIVTP